jgi:hypothetical protein
MDAMVNRDWTALAACFEEDGKLFDYCPSCNGVKLVFLRQRRNNDVLSQ